jgi:hypothetical protein
MTSGLIARLVGSVDKGERSAVGVVRVAVDDEASDGFLAPDLLTPRFTARRVRDVARCRAISRQMLPTETTEFQ